MLTTRDGASIRARPMAVYGRRQDKAIHFLTDVRAHKDDEIRAHPQVCMTIESDDYICSVSGTATVSNDRHTIDELWGLGAAAWFKGKDDPNLRLLTVTPSYAEYWKRPGTMEAMLKMVFAAITGNRPDIGENEQVKM